MLSWFKRLFGFAEEVVTLAERHLEASKLAAEAVSTFHGIVSDLEAAAGELHSVADEAKSEAEALVKRAEDAVAEAAKHLNAASKIRGLLD